MRGSIFIFLLQSLFLPKSEAQEVRACFLFDLGEGVACVFVSWCMWRAYSTSRGRYNRIMLVAQCSALCINYFIIFYIVTAVEKAEQNLDILGNYIEIPKKEDMLPGQKRTQGHPNIYCICLLSSAAIKASRISGEMSSRLHIRSPCFVILLEYENFRSCRTKVVKKRFFCTWS